ncbi:plasmid stabilization protein [Opitutaceae bacterium TAV5]|nr:plasmid stabilization protein [Opitutaceae bacterium TAV5]
MVAELDFKVGLTEEAIADLAGIVKFIARTSPDMASHVGARLLAVADSLAHLPHRGSPVKARKDMRKVFCWSYALYYRIRTAERLVEVLRIWDTRRNPDELILPRK